MNDQDCFIFDDILYSVWSFTLVQARNPREAYRAATRMSEFLRQEVEYATEVREADPTRPARAHGAMPTSLINAWAWNVLEDCYDKRCPPPPALLEVIYRQLGCRHLDEVRRRQSPVLDGRRGKARKMSAAGVSVRGIAAELGVNPSTVSRWLRDDFSEEEFYRRKRELWREHHVDYYLYPWRRSQMEVERGGDEE